VKVTISSDIRVLIFDCDGTLVHTLPAHYAAWERVFTNHNIPLPLSYLDRFNSYPSWMIVEEINREAGLSLDPHGIANEKEENLFHAMGVVTPVEPVLEYVYAFKDTLPMAVISGGVRRNVIKSLDALSITGYFNPIIGADDGYPPKTDPDSFLKIASVFDVPPSSCIVFEDGDVGLQSAREAGMKVIDVRTDFN
jgi:beta-phosphoglucomutase-like phosphatase (HAD superfamily)